MSSRTALSEGLIEVKLACGGIKPSLIMSNTFTKDTIPDANSVWPSRPLTDVKESVSERIEPPNTFLMPSYSAGSPTGVPVP